MVDTLTAMSRPRSVAVRLAVAAVATLAVVAMHGSGAEAHSCGGLDEGATGISHEHEHEHEHHESTSSGESSAPHCGATACSAIVTGASVLAPECPAHSTSLNVVPDEPLPGTPAAPEPPVPRPLLLV